VSGITAGSQQNSPAPWILFWSWGSLSQATPPLAFWLSFAWQHIFLVLAQESGDEGRLRLFFFFACINHHFSSKTRVKTPGEALDILEAVRLRWLLMTKD